MRRLSSVVMLGALALVAASCGGAGGVDVGGAWARTSPVTADAGAVYLDITSGENDRVVGATVEPAIAGTVEVHETVVADMGDDEGSSEDGSSEEGMGAMTMREVGEIALPAGETVSLEPGGLHIMLLNLGAPLELGDTFEVTLQFATADDMTVEVEVRDEAP